jgi:hypothetical protein
MNRPTLRTVALVASALMLPRSASAAETIIGPGVLPPQQAYSTEGTRFVAGTEITATAPWSPAGTGETSKNAVYLWGGATTTIFEGGRYEGLSTVASSPDYTSPGSMLGMYAQTFPTVVIYSGLYRGGSVLVDTPSAAAGYDGAVALAMTPRYHSNLVLHGGVIEGGTVALQSDPTTPLKRSLAILAQGYYDYSRQQIDVYGGTLLGGVSIHGNSRITVHGSSLAISPDPAGEFTLPTDFTLTGVYANGSSFSHSVRAYPYQYGYIIKTPDSITIQVPEPSGFSLVLIGFLAVPRLRRRDGILQHE